MTDFNFQGNKAYHKFMYIGIVLFIILADVFDICKNTPLTIISIILLLVFWFLNSYVITKYSENKKNMCVVIRFLELLSYNILEGIFPSEGMFVAIWTVFIAYIGIIFILEFSDFEEFTILIRKIIFVGVLFVKLCFAIGMNQEQLWLSYFLTELILFVVVVCIVNVQVSANLSYLKEKNELNLEISRVEDVNTQLNEYQEKVKSVNEQINYQKIDLAKTLRELEQVNVEIESQNEIMKYMTSTFDVPKCINVITDSIMEVKKPKLCALYIGKDVYYNKDSSCIIKTNYTSMQRRLRKEIEYIFEGFSVDYNEPFIIYGQDLKNFKFIGEANINSLAMIPLGTKKPYGLLLVGSDKEDFFDKGLNYYQTCILEFDVAIKSTKLFLETQDMARKDGLTGIYNRVYNGQLYKKAAKHAEHRNQPLSVALFDIDKFKNVNDTYGHLAGDNVIKMVANVAKKYADKYNGFASRYGGEEFLLTLPGYDVQEALEILENMHQEIKSTVVLYEDIEIGVNVCIGLSSYPSLCQDVNVLVNRADKAMYYGKKHGRGRLIVDNPDIDEP